MRPTICAAAVAGALFWHLVGASPLRGDLVDEVKHDEAKHNQIRREDLTAAEKQARKYFHEPGESNDLGHYDARFFHAVVSDEERNQTQSHMMRAYLNFFQERGLDTWIAHGTLLGWWWNGKRLPWDWDMDTQVSSPTLDFLGEKYNQTRHIYTPDDGSNIREYLLDVNPWIAVRDLGDGMNIIDARWIDVSNGLFIDITGLSETSPEFSPGVWSCKNNHRYRTTDLYPMRETIFEGVAAKVPYAYDRILIDEYREKALVLTEYQGHKWDPEQRLWLKTPLQMQLDQQDADLKDQQQKLRAQLEEQSKTAAAPDDGSSSMVQILS